MTRLPLDHLREERARRKAVYARTRTTHRGRAKAADGLREVTLAAELRDRTKTEREAQGKRGPGRPRAPRPPAPDLFGAHP